ncbi:MAG: ABC transporter permease subunit [Pseudomonadota bacterium]|nr:ABC transporter permease subunit [Pseudomonadota bacterium]
MKFVSQSNVSVPSALEGHPVKGRSLWVDAGRRLRANRAAMVSLAILMTLAILVTIGPWLSPYDYETSDWDAILLTPSLTSGHIFGTDFLGRDLFARTLYGGRISLLVGVAATLVSLIIGISYGATAGYLGGRVDSIMMRIVDILYAMPFMFFVILLMVIFGRNILLIFAAIGAINWLDMARIVRGQTLSLKQREFVEAAQAYGVSSFDILRRHVIPNLLGVVVVYVTLTIPQVILVESFLSFLGLGVQEPQTSWGALVNDGAQQMETAPWLLVFPALFLALTLFCFNFIGDGLRDALDPKDR